MPNHTILIVDDEPAYLETIVNCFEGKYDKYEILQALNGTVAFDIAKEEVPDLIITDWEMPGITGIELIGKLKEEETTKDIPVIMCSGVMTTSENLHLALNAGAVDYIRKPIDKLELISRTQSMLKLAESHKEIRELNATKDKFFSIIAHDLKSPLYSISSFTELLVNDYEYNDDTHRKSSLNLISNRLKTLTELLENLLTWSRSQRNKISFRPISLSSKTLLNNSVETNRVTAEKKEVFLKIKTEEDLKIFCDEHMIYTVIRNLVSNAIKFTPAGGIITVEVKAKGNFAVFKIEDNGMGIPERDIPKLFSIDESFTTPGTNNEKGTGLGLILCKEFVTKNGGEIWVESKEGIGTVFYFTIPL